MTYGSRLNERRRNTAHRYDEDGDGVVVILIKGPENQAGELEDVEWMEHLMEG